MATIPKHCVTRRILVATDGSPRADRAVDAAASMARTCGAELVILTIGGSISGAELRQLAKESGDLSKSLETAANQILQRARKRAVKIGAPKIKVQTGWGDPADAIIDVAKRIKPDVLVVGRRGQSGLSSLLLGSVSQKLANLAPCQVMVIP